MTEAVHSSPRFEAVRPSPRASPVVRYAVRLAVSVSVAVWLANAPGLVENRPSWILITVLMLVQPTVGASLLKSLLRAGGTLAGALFSILIDFRSWKVVPRARIGVRLLPCLCRSITGLSCCS